MNIRLPMLELAVALSCVLTAPGVCAADAITDAMQAAYAPYRAALFRTNSKAQAESEKAIADAQQSWQRLISRFAAKPFAPYDRDAEFSATLNAVNQVYAKAQQQIAKQQLSEAHETLEAARDLMAQLRQRNNVVIFSDHMNAYHAEMEHVLQQGAQLASAPQGMMLLMARAGVLEYLAGRLHSEAPAAWQADADFNAMHKAVQASVVALRSGLLSQDTSAVRQALEKLKAPYSRMFLKFG